jgi:hypothetical protein
MPDEKRTGTIESIVTDQGNGSSYCSLCGRDIDIFADQPYPVVCPGCGAELYFGSTYINGGGSD